MVMHLKSILPEPRTEEVASVIGHEEPEDKPPPTTQEGLRKLAERTQMRKDELYLAFDLNWTMTEPELIKKVVDENWCLEETGRPLWEQCAKLRELILDERMPLFSCEDRQRMVDSTEQLMARGDWHMDPGTTYHRRIKKKLSPKCAVPTEDVHRFFSRVWDHGAHPEEIFIPAKENSPWFIGHPAADGNSQLELSFSEWMTKEDAIKKCLSAKHNLSALGSDGIGYCHLKFGKEPMIKFLAAIFKDCIDYCRVPAMWKCSRTALLYKKGKEEELKNWRPITVTSCVYRLFIAMITQWI
jgi:hypothetical protein